MTESRKPASSPVKGALSYTLAGIIGKAIGFLTLPLYTQVLTPDDYGRLTVVTSIGAMVTVLLMFGLDSPLIRIFFELSGDPERQRKLVDSLWRFVIVASSGGCIVLAAISLAVLGTSTDGTLNGPDVTLGLVATSVGIAATSVSLPTLRAAERFRGYLIVMATTAAGTVAMAALFVLVLRLGVTGALVAGIIANLISLATAMAIVPWRRGSKVDRTLVERSLRMGIPLIPHFASMQALILADRLILLGLVSGAALGLFGLASNIALPALIACQSITMATMPSYARAGLGDDDASSLTRVVTAQIAAVAFVTAAVAMLGPPLVGIMASSQFADAAGLVGWIALGYGFMGLYGIPMNGATIGAGRTSRAWIATMAGAAANIGLIYLLTPPLGIEGAAIASAGGYLVLLVGIGTWAHAGPNPVRYDLPRTIAVVGLALTAYLVGIGVGDSNDLVGFAIRSALLLALALLLLRVTGFSAASLAESARSRRQARA